MRTRHWLAGLMGGYLALAGIGTADAQPPGMPTNGNPDQVGVGMLPAPYNMTYGPVQPNSGPMNSPGYPPGANAWPNVSPYAGPPVDSTAYENGFWYNLTRQGSRRYYGSVDAVYGKSSKPTTTLIGAPNVNSLTADSLAGRTGGTTGTTATTTATSLTYFNQAPSGTGPTRSATATAGGGGAGGGLGGGTGTPTIFPSYDTGVLTDTLTGTGVRGTWGWFNNDDTGFVVSGFMQSRGTSSWGLVDPALVIDPNNQQNYNPILHLHAWFGVPLAGADTDATTGAANSITGTTIPAGTQVINDGAVVPYDMGVNVSFTSRIAGGNTDWYFNPIYDSKSVKIRPLAGVKYVRLQEAFTFDGYDSGLGYTVNSQSGAGGIGGGGATTGGSTGGYLTPLVIQPTFSTPDVIHSHLASTALSNMIGSEIGIRMDLGGSKFQFWTQTKAGALVNVSQRQIAGYNIGNDFNIIGTNPLPAMPNNIAATAFSTNSASTSLVPMFEQQFNFKVPIFNLIPYLNKMEIFERAQLTGGYTFLFLGDIYRPQNNINWNQTVLQPNIGPTGVATGATHVQIAPTLNDMKSSFYNSMFNLGVEWQY